MFHLSKSEKTLLFVSSQITLRRSQEVNNELSATSEFECFHENNRKKIVPFLFTD